MPPDPDRRILSTTEYKSEVGAKHGYRYVDAAEKKASKNVATYYAFRPRKGIELISLDTVAEGGGSTGNLDDPQYKWLEKTLKKAEKANRLVIAYGHHTLATMNNTRTDEQAGACSPPKPGCDADPRKSTPLHRGTKGAKTVRDLFLKYPNVIAYVAGHTHENRVDLYRKGKSGFWQINTASHADWPQQSRLIEVMDNHDGTLSLFNTVLDQAARSPRRRPARRPRASPTPSSAASAACWRGTTRSRPRPISSAASRTATSSSSSGTRASARVHKYGTVSLRSPPFRSPAGPACRRRAAAAAPVPPVCERRPPRAATTRDLAGYAPYFRTCPLGLAPEDRAVERELGAVRPGRLRPRAGRPRRRATR